MPAGPAFSWSADYKFSVSHLTISFWRYSSLALSRIRLLLLILVLVLVLVLVLALSMILVLICVLFTPLCLIQLFHL